jgi:hypothetical protein
MTEDCIQALRNAKTPRAFDSKSVEATDVSAAAAVSSQYADFLRSHGAVRMFPRGRAYRLHVTPTLQKVRRDDHDLLELGNDDGEPVYFLAHDSDGEPRVYTVFEGELEEVGASFDEWFASACERIRNSYSDEEWKALLDGPSAFSSRERAVIEARRKFDVSIEGIEPDKRVRLRVHNGSELTLPWLTVGVRSTNPPLEGALWLDVSNIKPGTTATLTVDAYRDQVDPANIELELRDPRPEDRKSFRELSSK